MTHYIRIFNGEYTALLDYPTSTRVSSDWFIGYRLNVTVPSVLAVF